MERISAAAPKLLVGLGNPGAKYDRTRHNAGFWLLDELAASYGVGFKSEPRFHGLLATVALGRDSVWLLKPMTYMNDSGRAVGALMRYGKIDAGELVVAHDDLDLGVGVVKLKIGGGHGGHNGLRSLLAHIHSPEFCRIRIGIGHPGTREQVTDYVLGKPSAEEEAMLRQGIARVVPLFPQILRGEWAAAMNRLHARRPEPG